jgi:transposase-like protein
MHAWIPHMPDRCPFCSHRRPVVVSTDDDGIPNPEHRCPRCEVTFIVLVQVPLDSIKVGRRPPE